MISSLCHHLITICNLFHLLLVDVTGKLSLYALVMVWYGQPWFHMSLPCVISLTMVWKKKNYVSLAVFIFIANKCIIWSFFLRCTSLLIYRDESVHCRTQWVLKTYVFCDMEPAWVILFKICFVANIFTTLLPLLYKCIPKSVSFMRMQFAALTTIGGRKV